MFLTKKNFHNMLIGGIIFINSLQASSFVNVNIDNKIVDKNVYNNIHLFVDNKKYHVKKYQEYIFPEISKAKKILILAKKRNIIDKSSILLLAAYVFPSEKNININVKSTITALVIDLIGTNLIYELGVKEAKKIIYKHANKLINDVNKKIKINKYYFADIINKEHNNSKNIYSYNDYFNQKLVKVAHNSFVEIKDEIKMNNVIIKQEKELKTIEPLNTNLYINMHN